MIIQDCLFMGFAAISSVAAMMTLFSRQAIQSILWLVLVFFSTAALWLLLSAEFLSLILVLVYVGAVMTLFLFIVMTVPQHSLNQGEWRPSLKYFLCSIALMILWFSLVMYVLDNQYKTNELFSNVVPIGSSITSSSNGKALGVQLYTQHIYPFELAGVLLLIAVVAVIVLSSGVYKIKSKRIAKRAQIQIKREERVKLVQFNSVENS